MDIKITPAQEIETNTGRTPEQNLLLGKWADFLVARDAFYYAHDFKRLADLAPTPQELVVAMPSLEEAKATALTRNLPAYVAALYRQLAAQPVDIDYVLKHQAPLAKNAKDELDEEYARMLLAQPEHKAEIQAEKDKVKSMLDEFDAFVSYLLARSQTNRMSMNDRSNAYQTSMVTEIGKT